MEYLLSPSTVASAILATVLIGVPCVYACTSIIIDMCRGKHKPHATEEKSKDIGKIWY